MGSRIGIWIPLTPTTSSSMENVRTARMSKVESEVTATLPDHGIAIGLNKGRNPLRTAVFREFRHR